MIVQEYITIKLNPHNISHYKAIGYYGKFGDEITVRVSELPTKSKTKVKFMCDICLGKNQISEDSKYKECQEMESMLLQSFEFGVISKEEFPDGFTETTHLSNLSKNHRLN